MTNSIDTRIIEMKFDNTQFQAGVRETLNTIETLNKNLKFDGASKGLKDLNSAGKDVNLSHIAAGVESIQQKFSAMSVVAITALSTIANKAVSAGASLVKSLTIGPISEGFSDYNQKLTSVQTIMNATGASLKTVDGYFKELDVYADKTIYNLTDMTGAFAKFTNAGVGMDKSVPAIKGIANMVALAGQNSQAASIAMYNLSQSIAGGFLTTTDYKSLNLANVATKEWKDNMIAAAVSAGKLKQVGADSYTVVGGSADNASSSAALFNERLAEGWASTDVLLGVLGDYGDATTAIGKKSLAAAQDVKSLPMMMETLKASVGTGWTDTFEILLGDVQESKALFTGLTNSIGGVLDAMSEARNGILRDWKALGGRTDLIEGMKNVFQALGSVIKPIKDAFREIFPPATGAQLAKITATFREFTEKLKIGGETANNIKRTFAGVFAIFGIGFEIVKQVARVFFDLFGTIGGGSGGILAITGTFGDFLVAIHRTLKSGQGLTKFFETIGAVLKIPIKLIQGFTNVLGAMFDGLNTDSVDGLAGKFKPFTAIGKAIGDIWSNVGDGIAKVLNSFGSMSGKFAGFGDLFKDIFGDLNFDHIIKLVQTGLLGGVLVLFRQFISSFGDGVEVVSSWKEHITGPFDALTDTLGAMQNTLRAVTLLAIAAAVGILAASVVSLSKVDGPGLARALSGLTVLFAQLAIAMLVFQKIDIKTGMGQLILVAAALRILTSSVVAMADLEWDELARGLTGTAVLLLGVAAAAQLMPDGKKMISSSLGIIIMAGAIKVLVSAVTDLAGISWGDMTKGLIGVGALLASLGIFTKLLSASKMGVIQGAGLVLLGAGIKILASAVIDFADMSWGEVGRGLTAMAGGLTLIAAALLLIPPTSLFSAAAVLIVASSLGMIGDAMVKMGGLEWDQVGKGLTAMAGALTLISLALALLPPTSLLSAAALLIVASAVGTIGEALAQMGSMSWVDIAKGLVLLAGALTIISIAMLAMTTALPGAAALLVVSSSLAVLAPILLLFGGMSWGEIVKGLTMLAGAFTVIGLAGVLLTPLVPTLLGLGAAIGLLGIGVAAAGVGVLAFATGLTALAASGFAATTAVVGMVKGLLGVLPAVAAAIGESIIAFAKVIARAGPAITMAITAVLLAFMDSIIRLTPKIANTMLVLINNLVRVLQAAVPKMVQAGVNIVVGILNGIAKNVNRLVPAAASLIVAFLGGVSRNLPSVINAGFRLIIAFVNGLANAIRANQGAMNAAGRNLALAIIDGMTFGLASGIGRVAAKAREIASSALNAARRVLDSHSPSREFIKLGQYATQGFVIGLDGGKPAIVKSVTDLQKMISTAQSAAIANVKALDAKLKKLNRARNKDRKAINATAKALAEARSELAKTSKAMAISKTFADEVRILGNLSIKADLVAKKLADARTKLADATKIRDDFNKTITEKFDDLPDFSKETKLADYTKTMEQQIVNTQIFRAQLDELKKRGLNEDMYRDLLDKGLDAMPFVQQILEGGTTSIEQLNTLGSALTSASGALGTSAAKALYQAGVDAAAGLVKGLENQQKAIEAQMDAIAATMVKAIKKALGIKSPSREMMKVGDWSAKGLAEGFEDSKYIVKSAERVGSAAIDVMRKSLSDMPKALGSDMDLHPSVRPFLDLSEIQKNAGQMNKILSPKPLNVDLAYRKARDAALEYEKIRSLRNEDALVGAAPKPGDTYIQNNYSPKALSSAEIYRGTRNQISKKKPTK